MDQRPADVVGAVAESITANCQVRIALTPNRPETAARRETFGAIDAFLGTLPA